MFIEYNNKDMFRGRKKMATDENDFEIVGQQHIVSAIGA